MELISKWSAIVAGCEQAAAELGYEGATWDSDARAVAISEARAQAFAECMKDLESASTPRPPKAEWFGAPVDADGKPTGKWDRWMVGRKRTRGRKSWVVWTCSTHTWMVGYWPSRETVVLPVAREGFPAPVDWDVVGG